MSGKMLASCGLDCRACRAFIATRTNDHTKYEEIARLWTTPTEHYTAEDIPCDGCHTEKLHTFCRVCEARSCTTIHGYTVCGDCPKYPCGKLKALWRSFFTARWEEAKANLDEYVKAKQHKV